MLGSTARRPMAPRSRVRRLTVALLVPPLMACGADRDVDRAAIVVVGVRSDFDAFNPVVTTSLYGREVNDFALFTPLLQYDRDLRPGPWLAESWELLADTAVLFRLRQDVRWHDGRPVTAEDVKFTFDLAKDPTTASLLGSAFLSQVRAADVEGPHAIRFTFERPHAQALEGFLWAPVPRHLLWDVPPAELRTAPFNRAPVGSGPFRFERWEPNQQLVLVRNPEFPAALGGPPAAERVVFRIIVEATTMLTELLTGRVHVDLAVLPDQARRLEDLPDVELHTFPGRTVYYVGWNNERPPFHDRVVRRALASAIDRQEIVDAMLYGAAEIATSTIPPAQPLYPRDVPPLPFDAADAAGRLERAGWVDLDGDGIREKDGRPLRFTLLTSDDPLRRAVVEVLQSQLRRVGAAVEIRVLEFQTMLQLHRERDFDAVFTNWVLDNFNLAAAPFALFHSSQADVPRSPNRSGVGIPELDALIERGAAATDEAEQRAVWGDFTRVLQREQPVTMMFWVHTMAASRAEVDGVAMDPRGELRTIARWSIRR